MIHTRVASHLEQYTVPYLDRIYEKPQRPLQATGFIRHRNLSRGVYVCPLRLKEASERPCAGPHDHLRRLSERRTKGQYA